MPKPRKSPPHPFVLEALEPVHPRTQSMFSAHAVYVGQKLVLFLRDSLKHPGDNGVWIATIPEHHASLCAELPSMRAIGLLDGKIAGWQVLPIDAEDFEREALHACDLILRRDPRIGKIPKPKGTRKPKSRQT